MATDEPGLSAAEQKAVTALRMALRDPETEARVTLRARTWLAGPSARRGSRVRWILPAAAALVVVAVAGALLGLRYGSSGGALVPTDSPTPIPSLPGTPGHFDNGEFSFDYPMDWPVLAYRVPESCGVIYLLAAFGTGGWELGTNQPQANGGVLCGLDSVTVPSGGIVVRIYWRGGGPAPMCESPAPTANETFGSAEALKMVNGDVTTWEFRWPDGQFFWSDDPIFEVHTSDAAQLAKAEAMVASFRWGAQAPTSGGLCSPTPAS